MLLGTHVLLALVILRLLSLEPHEATLAAAQVAGWPELGPELVEICKRESPGYDCRRRVGLHSNNTARAAASFYRKAVAHGWLDPEHCPEHRATTIEEKLRFAVRGNHGLAAAYSLHFLAMPCTPPEALDVPFLSALAAARRAQQMCTKHDACTRAARRDFWAGRRNAKRRRDASPTYTD